MSTLNKIQYLQNHEIDRVVWDSCIQKAENGLIYATSTYLDHMASNWDAVIIDDFNAVVPLPWRIKFGIKYVYTPPFIQQLGLFNEKDVPVNVFENVVKSIYQKFKFGEYHFNYTNIHIPSASKSNFVLDLKRNYSEVRAAYKRDLVNNLKKAQKLNLTFRKTDNYDKAINLYKDYYKHRTPHVSESDYKNFLKLCTELYKTKQVVVREVVDKNENLLAICLCLVFKKKIHVLLSTTTNIGRNMSANHFLFDELIKEFSSEDYILDFEGSDIPTIAHFYKNFGSSNEPYFFHRWNHLPRIIAWVKN